MWVLFMATSKRKKKKKTQISICPDCGREFGDSQALWVHMKFAAKNGGCYAEPICKDCGRKFDTFDQLYSHRDKARKKGYCPTPKTTVALQHSQTEWSCPMCGRVFDTKRRAQQHTWVARSKGFCSQPGRKRGKAAKTENDADYAYLKKLDRSRIVLADIENHWT